MISRMFAKCYELMRVTIMIVQIIILYEQRVSEFDNELLNGMQQVSNETSCFTRSGSKADLSRVSVRGFAVVRFRSLGRTHGRLRDSLSMVQRRPYRAFYRLSIST